MRLLVTCLTALCLLSPSQSQAAWDIFQSYVILDSGSGDQYFAGGANADLASNFDGTDLGDFTAADALTLNGGELKTYKNGSSNVCGGNLNYRVYASGDTPGAFGAINLTHDSELGGGDQKWNATGEGIDLLGALTTGDYILELYWDASGDDAGGCSDTKYDSNGGSNFTAFFSIVVPGCTDPAYTEYDAAATTDDGSCATAVVNGCTDPAYTEYNAAANTDDGSCATAVVNGCTDPAYTEYNAAANTDDGSCATAVVNGCTDPAYTEYNAAANTNDGSCATAVVNGCTDPAYTEYDASANTDDGSCATAVSSNVTNTTTGNTYANIQNAIDAASAGDVISLAAGTFSPTGTVTVDKSLTIAGAGSASTTIDVGGYNAWGIYITADDVTLSGVTIQGDAVANQQFALKAGTGNNTGGTTSICQNLTYSDIVIQGTKRTAIDLNGVNWATLTDITATGATGGFGMSISSSANVTVTNLTTSGNAWGDVGIFPANSPYQWPSLEGPTGITFDGTIDLSSGTGSISVQDGALQSGGTWVGTISNDAADNADVTVPASFSHVVNSTRDSDGLVLHNVGPQAAIHATAQALAGSGAFSGTTIDDLDNGDIEVVEGLSIQDAIDAASAGDVISLAAGTFSPTGTVTVDKSLTIAGAGSASTTIDVGGYNAWGIYITADDVTLSGVTIQGDAVANQQFALKAGTGNNTGGTTSICQNLTYSDIVIQGTKRTAIDLNGVNGATLTDITATGATGGFGMSISSSANVTVTNLTTSGNAWGDVGIFPANSPYQWPSLEGPTGITFGGTIDLSSGTGSISVQDGALQSGGTWVGTISNNAAENADITVPSDFDGCVNATRNDGLSFHAVSLGAAGEGIAGLLTAATTPFTYSAITFQNLTSGEWAVFGDLAIQDAIDAASAGDAIELEGTFSPSATINVNKSLTLYGQGSASTTINAGGTGYGVSITADDVHLQGFTLDGAATFGVKASGVSNFSLQDVAAVNGNNSAIDLNGVNGATLTDISASNTALGYGLAIASSSDVTVNGITTSSNAFGAIGIFPAQTQYQASGLEAPSNISIGGSVSLNGGAGAVTVQNGALASGGTWVGTVSNDAADNADVTVPAGFTHAVFSTRNDGLTGQSIASQAVIAGLVAYGAANPIPGVTYEDVYVYDMVEGDYEVFAPLLIQDAIDAASAGDVITVADGTYTIETPIAVNKAVTLQGQSEAGVVLDCDAALGGANSIQVTAGATLKDFTLNANSNATFGIHVQPGTANAALSGLTITNTASNGIGLSGVTDATVSDIAGSGNVQYVLGIAGSVGVTASDISGGNVGVYKGTGTYAQTATDITFTGTFDLAGGFVIEQLTGADEITYAIDGSTADVKIPADFDRVFFANYTSLPLPPPYNEASLATLVEADNLATAIGTAQALDGAGYGLEDAAVYNLTADQWEVSAGLSIQDAIDRAAAGDLIDIAAGTFSPTGTVSVDKSLTIAGAGSASTTIDVGGYNAWGIYITADDVTLSGVTIQGDAVANQQFALKAGTGNNTGGTTSICQNLTYSDIVIQGTKRTAIDLNGVNGATLTDITATGATGGFGMSISSSANVTVTNLTTSGNTWGDVGIFPANSPYQWPSLEGPTGITFDGTIDLSSGTGSISVQDGALQSGGTWVGTISNDAADNADVTVPASFSHVVNSTRDSDGLVLHNVGPQAAIHATAQALAGSGAFSGTTIDDLDNGDIEVVEGLSIQDAIDAASAGDVITVADGTYEEDLALNKGVTLSGPNAGIAHDGARSAEAIIDGEHTLSAAAAMTLDGLQFLSNNPAQTSTIYVSTAAGHAIQNNRFVSSIAGGNTGGIHDLAIYTAVLSTGSMTISGNSISGDGTFADGDRYSTAAWGRGIWLNGGGAAVTISGNAFTNCRTAMNLEGYANSACSVDGNTFTDCGTGLALGVPTAGDITSITNNSFQDVDTDINARNLTADISWNLATTANTAIPGNSTVYSDLGYIPGNSPGDIDDPNGSLAYLSGSGADHLTFGAEDNTVTGDYGGAANDYLDGGDGTDGAQYGDSQADASMVREDDRLIVTTLTAGVDTLVNMEFVTFSDGVVSLSGCTFPDACNFVEYAMIDDGSCEFASCSGCRDEDACNYDATATLDGPLGTCTYPGLYQDCSGNCINDANANGICDELDAIGVDGCTDPAATNYNPDATNDDGSCYTYTLEGCLIPSATNYDPTVNVQGEPISNFCIFPWNSAFMLPSTDCADPFACNYDATATGYTECDYCLGCTDDGACNYDDTAFYDDGSCTYVGCSGCTSSCSANYDATAVIDDGSCDYANCGGCTDSEADNYDAGATIDDGSCQYAGCTLPSACNFDADANANDGSCSLDPAPVISAVELVLNTTSLTTADGEVAVTVDSGSPISFALEGLNGASDLSFAYPGQFDGIAAGYYSASVSDSFGCVSNSLDVVVSYDLCCDCGVSDADSDGICDDEDNCTDKSAANYADPANGPCTE